MGIIKLPWIIKPLYGIISDTFPLFGYRRKNYLILFGFIGFLLRLSMAIANYIEWVFLILFTMSVAMSFCNVIAEALIVEISKKKIL